MPNVESIKLPNNSKIVGLFGTCGNSRWRESIIKTLDKKGIYYFNPQKDDWKDEDAKLEAEHLANDEIIVFSITEDTYGSASLIEVGLCIKEIFNTGRSIIVYIDPHLVESLDDKIARHESLTARYMLITRLPEIVKESHNVYIVNDLDQVAQKVVELVNEEKDIMHDGKTDTLTRKDDNKTYIYDFDASDSYVAKLAEMAIDIRDRLQDGNKIYIHIEKIDKRETTEFDSINKNESRRARNIALEHLEKIAEKNPNLILCTKEQIRDVKIAKALHEAVSVVPGKPGAELEDINYEVNKGIGE